MTVSHTIVILLTLTCQLTPKSNSHISLLLLRLYISYSISNAIQFQLAQQCIQISTRINSSSVHTYIFVCFIRNSLRVILQGFVDPIMQHFSYTYLTLLFITINKYISLLILASLHMYPVGRKLSTEKKNSTAF